MKTLDRYIVRSFLFSALLWLVILMTMRIVIDLFVNMDEFVKLGEELDKSFGEIMLDIVTYYGYQSLLYFTELGGVIIVAAAVFTLGLMNHTNELTATLASGVSLHRITWPIILCAMLLGGLVILDQEVLIPPNADKLVRSRDDVPGTATFAIRLMADGGGSVWYSHEFRPAEKVMDRPVVIIRQTARRNNKYRAMARLSGTRARPAKIDDVSGWLISEGWLSRMEGSGWPQTPRWTKIYTSTVGPGKLLALSGQGRGGNTPSLNVKAKDRQYGMTIMAKRFDPDPPIDGIVRGGKLDQPKFEFRGENGQSLGCFLATSARWVPAENKQPSHWQLTGGALFYPSDLTADDLVLRRSSRWLDYMSTWQISRLLKLRRVPDHRSAVLARHLRITDPINNLVMLLLGLPFILSRERNIKASATLCLLMVGAYYAFIYICRYMGLAPVWAAWLPILLFAPVAIVMFDSVKT